MLAGTGRRGNTLSVMNHGMNPDGASLGNIMFLNDADQSFCCIRNDILVRKGTTGENRHQIIGKRRSFSADHRNVIGNIIAFFFQNFISDISQLDSLTENGGYFFLKHSLNALLNLFMSAGLSQYMMFGTVRGKGRKCVLISGNAGVCAVAIIGVYDTTDVFVTKMYQFFHSFYRYSLIIQQKCTAHIGNRRGQGNQGNMRIIE